MPADQVPERVVLVHVQFPQDAREAGDALGELRALAESAGGIVVGTVQQRRPVPDRATFLGSGKVEELKELCTAEEADAVVFGHDLSPAQGRNVEQRLGLRVLDRSQLIMDLFASRARTHQAILQVELAQLQYSLPRLRRLWTHLDRYKGGIGMKGPGETQLEIDRREIGRKIADRKKKLFALERQHQIQRESRQGRYSVGLLGYTNAGKSTLFNALTEEHVLAENRPFTTLDTRTRVWKVETGCSVLLSDTIGFIHDLPHHLIASFHATLAEALEADLLLHVVDGARADADLLVRSVEDVLQHIGAGAKPRLLVINKVDAVEDRALLSRLGTDSVHVSARTGEGLAELGARVAALYRRSFQEVQFDIPVGEGAALALVESWGQVLQREHEDGVVRLRARVPSSVAGQLSAWVRS